MAKDKLFLIRVTEHEKTLAKATSIKILGKENVSKLFIRLVNSASTNLPVIQDDQLIDFRKAVGQLSGIARNLNQIARRVNSEDIITKDTLSISYLMTLKDYVANVNNEFKKIIKDNS